jgi:flotillin
VNTVHPALLALQDFSPDLAWLLMVVFGVFILFSFLIVIARRYKRCPSNRILVIYGKTTAGRSSKCLHGGGAFVWPLIQNYEYLSLDPVQIEIPLQGALSIENIRVNVPSVFTVAIGTDDETMNNAAVRLLGLVTQQIVKQAEDIILGQLRQVIASMRIEEINKDRDVFLSKVQSSLEPELRKIGLVLINVNIKDITDESGYIEAIGRKAASEAIQQAEIDVALQVKHGAMGVAEADRDKLIAVTNAEKMRDIGTKDAERERAVRLAELEKGSQGRRADRVLPAGVGGARAGAADAHRGRGRERQSRDGREQGQGRHRQRERRAQGQGGRGLPDRRNAHARRAGGRARGAVRGAGARGGSAGEEDRSREARRARVARARRQGADDRRRRGGGEKRRIEAQGEASAIYAKLEAEARGNYEILAKKGQGLKLIVESCGGAQEAFQMLMLEHIEELARTAAQAISNVKFEKVVVWDGGGSDGKNGTAGFLRGLAGSLPPMMHMMRDIGGVEMPEYFGKLVEEEARKKAAEVVPTPAPAAERAPHAGGSAKS